MSSDLTGNFRNVAPSEPPIFGGNIPGVIRPPYVDARALNLSVPPPVPAAPALFNGFGNSYSQQNSYGYSPYMSGGGYGMYGNSFGGLGSGFGGGYFGGYNRYPINANDPEQRFIQLAENSSRPAFQSIESVVATVGNIANMLDSTLFAITSSFRAILGVAANFGRLRTMVGQLWQTFALFRSLNWMYRKLLYWLRISKIDPSSTAFKEAFAAAMFQTAGATPNVPAKGSSPWPVLAFLSFIVGAPYLFMKLIGNVMKTSLEETLHPEKWVNPIEAVTQHQFHGRNPTELTFHAGQKILIAPKEIQNAQNLMNTGWALASIDGRTSGLVPVNYIKHPSQTHKVQTSQPITNDSSQVQVNKPDPNEITPAAQPVEGEENPPNVTDNSM